MDEVLNRAIELKSALHDFIDLSGNEDSINNEYFVQERKYFLDNYFDGAPKFLRTCRSIGDFINLLRRVASGAGSWQDRREFIEHEFEDFLYFLEFGEISNYSEASIENGNINIVLKEEVFSHVKDLLSNEHYFNAVEEAYKIVREKLRDITGHEQAHRAFSEDNFITIFGHEAGNEAEKNFYEGVKFLHMAIQNLRNEKAHTPAQELDKNLAIHYIVLASLAYDLITRK